MFWITKPGWYGKYLDKNITALLEGDISNIPWIFCVFSEKHNPSKLAAAKALNEILGTLSFNDIVRIDEQMRQTTSMEWSINWREYRLNDFFTLQMSKDERRAVSIFASFNPNGFIREKAVNVMSILDGTLPYIILRQNDWVSQVRQAANEAFTYRLHKLSSGEILEALPFAEKLGRCRRISHGEYTSHFFAVLTSPEYSQDLMRGLGDKNVRTRRICVDALFSAKPPKLDLAVERLTREPDPFLRATIFRKLISLGQWLGDAIEVFLKDKYPFNRMLAFQYILDTNMDCAYDVAENFLLDSSAMVRMFAQHFIQKQTPAFDFRSFYLSKLDQNTAVAICGLGEKGQVSDAIVISKYLEDARISVVKPTMISLMRLDSENYGHTITKMLNDPRAGIVKTARNLIIKANLTCYEIVKEIFTVTTYKHTKLKSLDILFAAPKWPSIIYMLEALSDDDEEIKEKSLVAIKRWLLVFNRSYSLPCKKQTAEIRDLIRSLNKILPTDIQKELLFVLP